MNPEGLIHKYCRDNVQLEQLLLRHSSDVATRALRIAQQHPEFHLDENFLYEAAMLHDIGVVGVNASAVFCYGTEPYICHGMLGAEILRAEGLPLHAEVALRHTGTGLTRQEIIRQELPLPHQDLVPQTLAEEIICYADKFFSKSRPQVEKTPEQVERSLQKFGEESVHKFREWRLRFEGTL